MARTLLRRFGFEKGPSSFCANAVKGNPPTAPFNDPLYPEIRRADYVDVEIGTGPAGENVLTLHPDAGSSGWSDAGLWTGPFSYAPTIFELILTYFSTTAAIDDASNMPALRLGTADSFFSDFLTLTGLLSGADMFYEIDTDQMSALQTYSLPRAYIENRWMRYRIRGRVGSYLTATTRRVDGALLLHHRRDGETTWSPMYDLGAVDFGPFPFVIPFIKIGDAGLFGKFVGYELYEGWSDGQTDATLDPCCATSGIPGGGTQNIDGSVNPIGPRQGVVAGVPPSYTPCTGGGLLTTATDPTDPQTLDNALDPIIHLKLTPASSGVQRWGTADINAGTTSPPIKAKVMKGGWSPIHTEVLANRDGVLPAHGFSVKVQDATDRQIHTWTETADRFLLNRFAEALIETYGQRQIDTEARKLAAGYLVDWDFLDDLVVSLGFADLVGWRGSAMKTTVPKQTVHQGWAPDAPEDSLGRRVPWIYGEMNDERDWWLDNNRLPVGILSGIPVGKGHTINFTNLLVPGMGTVDWECFLIGKVCKDVKNPYFWNGDNEQALRGRLPVNVSYVTDYLFPSMPDWSSWFSDPFVRILGTDGVTQDFTMGFLRGPRGYQARVTGRYPVSVNVCGIEATGDGTGTMISAGAHQLAHFICYGVFGNHTSGVWGAIPTLPNGVPVLNRLSVDTTKTIHDLRLSGGYPGAFAVGATGKDGQLAEQAVTALARGFDIKLKRDHFGALGLTTLNDQADISSLVSFDDSSIRKSSAGLSPDVELFENAKTGDWGPEPATGRNTGLVRRIVDQESVTNWGETREGAIRTNLSTRVQAVADDVAARELLRDSNVPQRGSFDTDQRGLSLSAGQLIRLTSEWLPGAVGWINHVVQVTAVIELPNDKELLTTIKFDDVHALLNTTALQQSIFSPGGLATGPAWGNPIGDEGLGTAQPLGDEAAGTARRLS